MNVLNSAIVVGFKLCAYIFYIDDIKRGITLILNMSNIAQLKYIYMFYFVESFAD